MRILMTLIGAVLIGAVGAYFGGCIGNSASEKVVQQDVTDVTETTQQDVTDVTETTQQDVTDVETTQQDVTDVTETVQADVQQDAQTGEQ
jgi:uncharacterized protein YcfJ